MVRTYGPRLLALARRYLPTEADAEDALQDAFLSVFRSIRGFAGDSRLGTWLHRVTVNAALMKIRAKGRRPETSIDEVGATAAHLWPDPDAPPASSFAVAESISREETREVVRRAIDGLHEEPRIVVHLRDIERMELREISVLLGVGLSTVKSRLRRGRMALRAVLESHFQAVRR
jgi:RNA polymerase sigma-70 factor (ECF subfamily)